MLESAIMKPGGMMTSAPVLLAGFIDILYPPRCAGCDRGILAKEQPLCGPCMSQLERVDSDELERHIRGNIPRFGAASIFALWMFDKGGRLQRAQHLLKYGQRPLFGHTLGAVLAAGWSSGGRKRPDIVVPIPLHRTRHLERGYNQSLTLAEGLCRVLSVPIAPGALSRLQVTRRQTGLARDARRANVRGAFEGKSDLVAGKHILLLDDVITTGATASSAIDTLLESGATRVDFVALAHART